MAESKTLNTDDLNRTIFISDNLPFLKSLDTESVDLVVIDPPFGKKQTFVGTLKPPMSADELRVERDLLDSWGVFDESIAYELGLEYPDQTGTTANFGDIWNFQVRVYEDWLKNLESVCPPAYWLIQSTLYTHSESTAAYIAFMVERMLEIRRILKPTGSVYLHCDHAANAYLRQMMDAVFGNGENGTPGFRNEIIWKRQNSNNSVRTRFGHITDTILFYVKSSGYRWNQAYRKRSDAELREYREDENGRLYKAQDLTAPGRNPDRMFAWRGTTPSRNWAHSLDALEEMYAAGRIIIGKNGKPRRRGYKQYLDELPPGGKLQNLWDDVQRVGNTAKERTGYPTQKPQALARRIIETSSNPGDLVLDCFAGCAYVPVAAELTGRRWIACDMSPRAWTIVRRQFHKHPDLKIATEGEYAEGEGVSPNLGDERVIRVRGPHDLPDRTTPDEQKGLSIKTLPELKFRQRPVETAQEIWDAFVDEWGLACWYCGMVKQHSRRELPLDHIEPNKRDGSNDDCWNRALSCADCNGDKSDKLTAVQTINDAYERGRIPTDARRKEQMEIFARRHKWAKERWEQIKPKRLI